MKVYVVYQSLYGDLLQETGECTEILGVYDSMKKAKEKVKIIVNAEKTNTKIQKEGFVLDKETKGTQDSLIRFFWTKQENWNCYYEIYVEVREVE